jgi:hypothetical protein
VRPALVVPAPVVKTDRLANLAANFSTCDFPVPVFHKRKKKRRERKEVRTRIQSNPIQSNPIQFNSIQSVIEFLTNLQTKKKEEQYNKKTIAYQDHPQEEDVILLSLSFLYYRLVEHHPLKSLQLPI